MEDWSLRVVYSSNTDSSVGADNCCSGDFWAFFASKAKADWKTWSTEYVEQELSLVVWLFEDMKPCFEIEKAEYRWFEELHMDCSLEGKERFDH